VRHAKVHHENESNLRQEAGYGNSLPTDFGTVRFRPKPEVKARKPAPSEACWEHAAASARRRATQTFGLPVKPLYSSR
jgi:hypothetical protein